MVLGAKLGEAELREKRGGRGLPLADGAGALKRRRSWSYGKSLFLFFCSIFLQCRIGNEQRKLPLFFSFSPEQAKRRSKPTKT
jgi:hypothetical protein